MFKALHKSPNVVYVLTALIKKLNIPVSSYTINQDLEDHPDYPSLLALSDCLTSWNVPNEAFKIDKQQYKAEELSFPFIAHLKVEGGQFILVTEIKNDKVKFSNEQVTDEILTEEEFLKRWDGIMLYAQKDKGSGEVNYRQALIKGWFNDARLPFLVLITLLSMLYAVNYAAISWPYISLLAIKLSGIVISALLLVYGINSNNPFVQNLCSLGKKNDCNAILKSDAAKVTSWLSWSEVGMFYFSGSFICLLLNPSAMGLMSWLNLLCLPYTFYSIGYQIKMKNWCILCCSVQALLWLEAIIFFSNGYALQTADFNIGFSEWFSYLLCFLLPIAIWSFIKPFLLKTGQVQPLKQQLKKFKYNSSLFNQLLSSQARYAIPDELMPIVLGNPEAETVITMVSNPFCGPCAKAHKTLDEWISKRDDIQLKLLFVTANHDDDKPTKLARHATALSLLEDRVLMGNALNDWYDQSDKKYENWAEKYPVNYNGQMNAVTEKQKKWCELAEISFTPTILVNGYKLVDPYRLEDIKYLLE